MEKFSNVLRNSGNAARIGTTLIAIGGLIFQMGKLSERVDIILPKVHSLELDQKSNNQTLYDIHGTVSKLEEKLDNVAKDVYIIRKNLE